MRRTLRLFAAVKPARYLEPGAPTGLTGLYTHSSPRSTLLYLYTRTLEKLQQLPESSLYRQSVEALTKHRLSSVEAVEPPGYAEWAAKARKIAEANPREFQVSADASRPAQRAAILQMQSGGRLFMYRADPEPKDERLEEWDGEKDEGPNAEGLRGPEERQEHELLFRKPFDNPGEKIEWENEPQLTADQFVVPRRHMSRSGLDC
ncbi:ETC complex I subunit conserved region-domain-containing protein [Hypoxylon sp. NC0597]|nr:ETC complex I subunit conserved region-domain-containing protein [Hypoxylon sp. NC0597]